MLQTLLPIFPSEVVEINARLAFAKRDGHIYYFNGNMPIFSHAEDDYASFRMFTSQLYVNGNCTQQEIVRAFAVSSISVKRSVKKYRAGGPGAFFIKTRKSKPRVLTAEVLQRAQELFVQGLSRNEVCEELNLKYDTLYRAINSGRVVETPKKTKDSPQQRVREV